MTVSDCLNCAAPLPEPRPRYCPACGQETLLRPPKMTEFLQQLGGAYLSTEGALWRTLKLLLTRPGELTRQYLAGRRKHYVLPLRLYLTISVITLLLMRLLPEGAGAMHVTVDGQPRLPTKDVLNVEMLGGRAGLKKGVFYCHDLPQWMCARLKKRLDIDPQSIDDEVAAFRQRFVANLGAAMFVLLPTFALGLLAVYPNRRLYYTEHLVFALHVHAFWFVALALTLTRQTWLAGVMTLVVPVYTVRAMRRVYGGRWWPRWLRAAALTLGYAIALAFVLAVLALWTLLF